MFLSDEISRHPNVPSAMQQVGRPQVLATRLIPDHKFTDEVLLDSMIEAMLESDFGQILAVTPYSFKHFDKTGTSINPAWRTAVWHVSLML